MNASLSNRIRIRIPEGVTFALDLAGPVSRSAALAVDLVVIQVAILVVSAALVVFEWFSPDFAQAATILAYFLLYFGYTTGMEWYFRGQTLGKRLLRLRVMDETGLSLTFSQVLMRNLFRLVDMLPFFYLAGGIAMTLSSRAQRLGDIAAGTIVIRHSPSEEPDLEQLVPDKYNSFRDFPHRAARLRAQVTPAEAGIALRALLRRDSLESGARVALFRELADLFREKAPFPEEATEGLSDEKYVQNVVDVVYRRADPSGQPENPAPGKPPDSPEASGP